MYISIYVYKMFKFLLRVVERGFEELTQCNKEIQDFFGGT